MSREHITNGTKCWCNPQVINFNLSLGDVIHEGIENGKYVSYTMADILMGCRKIMETEKPNKPAWNDIHDRITDILVCGGFIKDEQKGWKDATNTD